MKPPPLPFEPRRMTAQEIEAAFKPCPICGEIEKNVGGGVYRIAHNMEAHFGKPQVRQRMTSEELLGISKTEWVAR